VRVALVLGAAVWAGGRPSPTLVRRARHAAALWQAGRVDAVLGCGGIGRHPPAEGAAIAAICRAAGVPEGAVHVEDQSRSTRENVTLAIPILRALGATEVVIVTDPYHAPRARMIARQLGLATATDCPPWRALGPRQLARHIPREGVALLATVLRLR
jgi:uncharacterized SAM-binding protein YcdF (DUF218 family)